ncbi:MAG: DUF4124 domain-containing protein [Enterobacterales bacterium]|nr:DUF4124 domain-containing protein [Enterobacterales bacterium]
MKIFISIIIMILLNGIRLGQLSAEIYQWTDPNGGMHFSDSESPIQTTKRVVLLPIPSIKTKMVKPIIRQITPSRSSPQNKSDENICQTLTQKINRIEKKLSQRHSASRFDQLISDLKQLRWNKLKNC